MAEVTTTTPAVHTPPPAFQPGRLVAGSAVIAVVGLVLLAIGLLVDPKRAWLSYLMAYSFAFTICVGGLIFLLIGYVTNARWMSVVRRTTEAVTLPIPALAVLFIPLLFGLGEIYPWHTHPAQMPAHEVHILEHRNPYLNTPFVAIRAVIYFAILIAASHLLRSWSLRRDREAAGAVTANPVEALGRERRFACAMLPLVGLAFTFAVIDWVMSVQGVWYSSMFPVNLFGGGFLTAIALVTIFTQRVWRHNPGKGLVTRNHFHALGRMLFAFTVFWAYTGFFQAMLIRIANKPEEVVFFLRRVDGFWEVLVWVLILGHFALPFLLLLPRSIKFEPRAMAWISGWLVLMHLVDIYWIVIPAHVDGGFALHWLDLGALAAVVGISVALAAWRHRGLPVVPERDPFVATGALYRSPL
jgi:hypothetical protein